ncbi:MAG: NADH-quinone oxidoreductase subunit H [Candidatus Dadabacteria bacterium]|nr:MAG: NADH-quinone oxidoreductase subunit H [Candidatus Dadabacteria bacterium]
MEFVILLIKIFVVLNIILGLASLCTWIERKGSALIQDRIGANRAGAFFETDILILKPVFWGLRIMGALGLINTLLCDAVKAITKEDFVPEGVSQFMHSLAPFMAVFPVFVAYAVIPIAPEFTLFDYTIRPQVAALDAGVLFILAMGSIAVYGVMIAGWTGNNKFSLLGALRASAQMISYELSMGIAFVTIIIVYGTMDLYQMIQQQGTNVLHWGVVQQPLTFIILFVVGMAETKRGPFDLPESESELVAGYFTEYSGMKFLLFWLGEFAEIALFAILVTALFFGGWHIPYYELSGGTWWEALIGHLVFMAKVVFFCILQIVIRWTLPRFRYDQLMNLGWKMLLPLSLANLLFYAVLKLNGFFT